MLPGAPQPQAAEAALSQQSVLAAIEGELQRLAEQSEERFRSLADNIAQLAWMADSDGHIFWYNRRWYEYTGTTLADAEGWGWKRCHHPEHVERVTEKIARCFAAGEIWEDTFPLRSAQGEYRWFLSRAVPVRNADGAILRWFGTNTDITERLETEERLREADRRKDEFLAMLGHELRNPLAAISGVAQLMPQARKDPRIFDQISQVLDRQVNQMTRLIDGLLEVSRVARGKIFLSEETLDLRHTLDAVLRDRGIEDSKAPVRLHAQLGAEPVWVRGDPVRLTQVFDNLLGNALKFTPPPGDIHVELSSAAGEACIQVRDSGIGIAPELLERIFQPFQQGPQDLARSSGGLGLGLALCEGIVTLHGGRIRASSAGLGQGSMFELHLPLSEPPQESVEDLPSGPHSNSHHLLLVEDNADERLVLRHLLQGEGHTVRVAASAREALGLIARERFEAVLCDVGLPDMSGYDFALRLRGDGEQDHSELPLIALTGYGLPQDRERSARAGFDRHLVKPLNATQLRRALAELLPGEDA